jgi:ATP-dependent exoDNAse (exonuclease V) alpha subunit
VLNQDQLNAADQLNEFLASDRNEFCLTGQAGTGKTYMLYSILGDRAKYCATTNKAASVLRVLTGVADTIHSLLSLSVRNDFKTGKTFLARSPKAKPYCGQIIVIDEASMIDKQLYKIIREMCSESKVIYVGDDAQLAPVQGSNFSIFKLGIQTANLTQVMRSLDTPDITELSTALRAAVFSGVNLAISNRPPAINRISGPDAHTLITNMVQTDNWRSNIVLSFTNARAAEAITAIRKAANKPIDLLPGDSVIVNSAFKARDGFIPTDSILQIEEISDIEGQPHLIDVKTDEGIFVTYRDNARLQREIAAAGGAKNWDLYFRLKEEFIDLRHAEALTIHKSQGSTFDTVFVDLGSLFSCRNPDDRRRLLYVACSRPRRQLYLVA